MKVGFYMNCVSAHQLPLAREVAKRVGADNFVYVDAGMQGQGFQTVSCEDPWISTDKSKLDDCDVILTGIRDFALFERRQQCGLATFYTSERWFKPTSIGVGSRCRCSVPGWVRMLVPSYRKMALRFVQLINSDDNFKCLPIGPWARKDFERMGVKSEKMIDWGYFVSPSTLPPPPPRTSTSTHALRVLWVGRPLWWKRVDTIRKAVAHVPNASLDVFTNITIDQVREEMRKHDVYVLASNAMEGWGAALSEAMEEGMMCFGTYEAGASAALLPESQLFHAGDWRSLAKMLQSCDGNVECRNGAPYSCARAGEKIVGLMREVVSYAARR